MHLYTCIYTYIEYIQVVKLKPCAAWIHTATHASWAADLKPFMSENMEYKATCLVGCNQTLQTQLLVMYKYIYIYISRNAENVWTTCTPCASWFSFEMCFAPIRCPSNSWLCICLIIYIYIIRHRMDVYIYIHKYDRHIHTWNIWRCVSISFFKHSVHIYICI